MVLVDDGYGQTYYVHKKLHAYWDTIRDGKLTKEDDDKCFPVDGRERSGKTLWTFQQACDIDKTIISDALEYGDLSRITFTGEETLKAIQNTNSTKTQTKVVIFDEAFRGLSSRATLSKTNKLIVQTLMEMGQKNLVLFLVLPSFFLLDRYPAVLRSNALFHIEKPKRNKSSVGRLFKVYNYQKKAALYNLRMDKGWGYPIPTRFRGNFYGKYPGGEKFEKMYRKKKEKALNDMEKELFKEKPESKYLLQRDIVVYLYKKKTQMSLKELSKKLTINGIPISYQGVSEMCKRGEKAADSSKKTI